MIHLDISLCSFALSFESVAQVCVKPVQLRVMVKYSKLLEGMDLVWSLGSACLDSSPGFTSSRNVALSKDLTFLDLCPPITWPVNRENACRTLAQCLAQSKGSVLLLG